MGAADAPDRELMAWARSNGFVVFTHDLAFGAILATTEAAASSVFQVRTQDITPKAIGNLVLSVFTQFEKTLSEGAIVTIDEKRTRARVLPLRKGD